jgi:SPP1 family predicted phage head-tail adaptor
MRAGARDRMITIQTPDIGVVDAAGARIPTWNDVGSAWASYQPVKDGERSAASQVTASITARFQIPWTPEFHTIDERHRVLFDGRVFDVVSVKEMGRAQGIEISATASAERGP